MEEIKKTKTSIGAGIELYWDSMIALHTDSNILINHQEKYYYEMINMKNKSEEVRLSNFVIEPLFVSVDENKKNKYILKFISADDSKVLEVDGEILAINNSFKKFCLSHGKFNWRGKQQHLDNLVDFIMVCATKELTMVPYVGWYSSENIWFFPTHAYFQGKVYFPDNDGVFEINNKYFKLDLETDDDYIIHPHITTEPTQEEIASFFRDLKMLYNNYFYLAFGLCSKFTSCGCHHCKNGFLPISLYLRETFKWKKCDD